MIKLCGPKIPLDSVTLPYLVNYNPVENHVLKEKKKTERPSHDGESRAITKANAPMYSCCGYGLLNVFKECVAPRESEVVRIIGN